MLCTCEEAILEHPQLFMKLISEMYFQVRKMKLAEDANHTIYSRNNMRQKCGGNCGLWILHEIIQNKYSENLRKIVGALWELPAK